MSEGLTGKATPGNEIIGFYIVSLIGKVLFEEALLKPIAEKATGFYFFLII